MGRCIECDVELPGFEKLCKECWEERYTEYRHPKRRGQWRDMVALLRQAPVTTSLVLLNIAVFVGMILSGVSPFMPKGTELLAWGAGYGPLTLNGQSWRAITEMFVHIGWEHLTFNMLCLLDLGILAEPAFGSITFTWCYFLTGISSSGLSLFFHPKEICAGASGAIFGIAGLLTAAVFFGTVKISIKKFRRPLAGLVRFVGYNLVFGLIVPHIDNAGHIGGLLAGLILGSVLSFTREEVVVHLPPPSQSEDAAPAATSEDTAPTAPLRRSASSNSK